MSCDNFNTFTYDGRDLSLFNSGICFFEDYTGNQSTGLERDIQSSEYNLRRNERNLYGAVYTTPLEFKVGIAKTDYTDYTPEESRAINNWLTHSHVYTTLHFNNNYMNLEFQAICRNIDDVYYSGISGKEITFECNSPFGYELEKTYTIEGTEDGTEVNIYNSSDDGDYYPIIEISVDSEVLPKITIENETDHNSFAIDFNELIGKNIALPSIAISSFYYTGEEITPELVYDSYSVKIEDGSVTSATNISQQPYPIIFGLKNDYNTWADDTTDDIILYWSINPYEITYNLKDGTALGDLVTEYTIDDTFVLPQVSRDGYIFTGWTGGKNAEISTPTLDVVIPLGSTGNRTYNANYTSSKYTITFNPNGGICNIKTKNVYYKKPYGELPSPTKIGYVFDGWYTEPDGGDLITAESIDNTLGDHTLYAHWKFNEMYALKFSSDSSFILYVEESHVGWNGTIEYSTNLYDWTEWDGTEITGTDTQPIYLRGTNNTIITGSSDEDKNWTFTGKYITGDIETLLNYPDIIDEVHPVMEDKCYTSMLLGCSTLVIPPTLSAVDLTDYCYAKMFWQCVNMTSAPSLPVETLANYCYYGMFYECIGLDTPLELPATVLTIGCYKQMFEKCAGLVATSELIAGTLAESCYERMYANCIGLKELPTLEVIDLCNSCYKSMFDGCSNIKLSESKTEDYAYPYRIPSFGAGVIATDALTDMFNNTGGTFSGTPDINKIYYTNFGTIVVYTVTFDSNNGSTPDPSSKTVFYGDVYGELPVVTRTGYTFDGWYTALSGGQEVTEDSIVTRKYDHTIYAHWKLINYNITYNLNGGTVSGNPTSYNVETETFVLNAPTRENYTFAGWTGSNGNTPSMTVSIQKGSSTGDLSYTANWTFAATEVEIGWTGDIPTQVDKVTINDVEISAYSKHIVKTGDIIKIYAPEVRPWFYEDSTSPFGSGSVATHVVDAQLKGTGRIYISASQETWTKPIIIHQNISRSGICSNWNFSIGG